ncbi:MAG: hypothetical protein GY765_18960 [bacterium]|nr:hypothetical protein [bacterium]
MKIKIIASLLFCLLFGRVYSSSDVADRIKFVNNEVSNIEREIKESRYVATLNYKFLGMCGPITINFYSLYQAGEDSNSLICVKFSITKESYWNEFFYYFDKNEKLIKFSKETFHRPDNLPKQAIIFHSNGRPLWTNYKSDLPIKAEDLKRIYKEVNEKMFDLSIIHGKIM